MRQGKIEEPNMGPRSSAIRFHRFNSPLSSIERGYLGEFVKCVNPYLVANCLIVFAAYCGPLSDITTSGMPWRTKNDFTCSMIDSEFLRWSLVTLKNRE